MFERNLGVRIFMFIMLGILALEFLSLGFVLDKILLKLGTYELAIDVFNSIVIYVFVADFTFKFFFKQNQSMQIAPYLSLPIQRNKLFSFLLRKEFTSFWNLYWLFLIVPFALKSITPFFGFGSAVLYILFFYLFCILISLFVNLLNHWIQKSYWFYGIAAACVLKPFIWLFIFKINLGDYMQQFGEWILQLNPLAWLVIVGSVVGLWFINRQQMRETIYHEMQGEKADKISSFSSLSFLDRFGITGDFIGLEIRMITRSPRLKQQVLVMSLLCLVIFTSMLYQPNGLFKNQPFVFFLYGIITMGMMGLIMGQHLFIAESAFFDGLSARKGSLFNVLKGKYMLYSSYSLFVTIVLLIPVIQGKMNLLFLLALLFYTIGPIYFMIFQNVVYNKTYFDLFDRGMMNWKGQSGTMVAITMLTMFLPVILILILRWIVGDTVTSCLMLGIGLAFTFTSNLWLQWIYNRFLKRRYKNMEGFRSNS